MGRLKVRFHAELCSGHGRCYALGPDLFDEDERGRCVLRHTEVTGELANQARLGEQNCPEHAITLEED